jgi:hypothetical protein
MTVIMSTTTMVLILGAIVFWAAGQPLLKSGTQHLADLGRLEFLLAAVRDIRVLSGLAAWIAWTICGCTSSESRPCRERTG